MIRHVTIRGRSASFLPITSTLRRFLSSYAGLTLLVSLLMLWLASCQGDAKHEAVGDQTHYEATVDQTHHENADDQAHHEAPDDQSHPVHWSYEGDQGPEHWAALCPEFALCGEGKRQSPIDLSDATVIDSISMRRDYQPSSVRVAHHEHVIDIIDNGHTIQVTYDEGSTLLLPEGEFDLEQFHFHLPSEHTVEGRQYAMELHLVHQSASGDLAVVGVLIEDGENNPFFATLVENLPQEQGQVAKFRNVIKGNNRPVQPRYGRQILIETAK